MLVVVVVVSKIVRVALPGLAVAARDLVVLETVETERPTRAAVVEAEVTTAPARHRPAGLGVAESSSFPFPRPTRPHFRLA